MAGLVNFFQNKDDTSAVVEAPAFSLTKVMAVVAPVMTVLATVLSASIKDVRFSSGQITAMIIAVVAFLAITGSSDVLARGIATSAAKSAKATTDAANKAAEATTAAAASAAEARKVSRETAAAGRSGWIKFSHPIAAMLDLPGKDEAITVLAASDADPPEYLCVRADHRITSELGSKVYFN